MAAISKVCNASRMIFLKGGGQALDTAKSMGPTEVREWRTHRPFRFTKAHIVDKFGQEVSRLETTTEIAND